MTTSRREREKQAERRERARAAFQKSVREEQPATASQYIDSLQHIIAAGVTECVLMVRSSTRNGGKDKLDNIAGAVTGMLADNGLTTLATHKGVETGKRFDPRSRKLLVAALKDAVRFSVPLVSTSTGRFVRHPDFDLHGYREARPTEEHFRSLIQLTGSTPLATVLDPDASNDEEEAFITRLSQTASGNKGGRPAADSQGKKQRALAMTRKMRAAGYGYREIARRITARLFRVSHMTVRKWVIEEGV